MLKEHVYPALLGISKFLSKTLKEQPDGTLLVDPSFSPEQKHNKQYYRTKGCIFDQSMILETYQDLLKAAKILNSRDPFLKTVKEQIGKLDAIKIGESGQIKEFREETKYGEIGEYIVQARRSGKEWFVGAMTNTEARTITLTTDFLKPGTKYRVNLYEDDDKLNTRTKVRTTHKKIKAGDKLTLKLKSSGGAALHFTPDK